MLPLRLLPACLFLLPLATADADGAPAAATALRLGGGVLVSWLPGEAVPDSFRVYGSTEAGGLTLLAEVSALGSGPHSALLPDGHARYGVSGVRAGWESGLVYALESSCVTIDRDPPGAYVHLSCLLPQSEKVKAIVVG